MNPSCNQSECHKKLESGNLNVGGIFGLLAGIRFITQKGVEAIRSHESQLKSRFVRSVLQEKNIFVYGAPTAESTGIVSFNIQDQDCRTIASILDSSFRIQTRAGFHCAPKIHRSLNTEMHGGTIRISPGVFNTLEQIDYLAETLKQISKQLITN